MSNNENRSIHEAEPALLIGVLALVVAVARSVGCPQLEGDGELELEIIL